MAMTMRLTPSMYKTFQQDFDAIDVAKAGTLDRDGVLELMTMQLARVPSELELRSLRLVLEKEVGKLTLDQYVDFIAGDNQASMAQQVADQRLAPSSSANPSITAKRLVLAEKVADSYKKPEPKPAPPAHGVGIEVAVSAEEVSAHMEPQRIKEKAAKQKANEDALSKSKDEIQVAKQQQSAKLQKRVDDKEKPKPPKPEEDPEEVYKLAAQSGSLMAMSTQEIAAVAHQFKDSKQQAESRLKNRIKA